MNIKKTIDYVIANIIYGTIGLFLHFVSATSEFTVLCRGLIGSVFIFLIMLIKKQLPDLMAIKKNLKMLFISGFALGFNWVFLFAGYKYGLGVTSLCNYMAPIFIVIICTVFFKEKLTKIQLLCIIGAFAGICLVSGVFEESSSVDLRCVIFGLLAAFGFVGLVLCNRNIHDIKPLDKTITQLLFSAIVVLPYVYFNNGFPTNLDMTSIICLIILGIVHTGIAYILYFDSVSTLPVNEVVIIGYIEPVLSVLISAIVFKEKLTVLGSIGAVLIIVSALVNELNKK